MCFIHKENVTIRYHQSMVIVIFCVNGLLTDGALGSDKKPRLALLPVALPFQAMPISNHQVSDLNSPHTLGLVTHVSRG